MNAQTEDWLHRHRLTVDDYYRMGEAGVLAQDARVELINGEIIDMVPPGSRHAAIVDLLTRAFSSVIGNTALLRVQSPLRLSRLSEPQPDLQLLRPRDDFYSQAHPGPDDVLLVIEVSESSTRYDRQIKLPLYATHGIREVWLINPMGGELHICREPYNGAYRDVTIRTASELGADFTTAGGSMVDLSRLFDL